MTIAFSADVEVALSGMITQMVRKNDQVLVEEMIMVLDREQNEAALSEIKSMINIFEMIF
uniref:Two-component-system connector protein YmgA n=1 Tax=Heterorhabditis bacteriophora TaxID=37862 RepID=A0A1I7WHR4_HETBA